MQRYFSPSHGGFFSEDVHGTRLLVGGEANPACLIPDDAVAVGDDEWRSLLAATSEGKAIEMQDGIPVAVDPPAPEGDA
jgi:hypothetical protein